METTAATSSHSFFQCIFSILVIDLPLFRVIKNLISLRQFLELFKFTMNLTVRTKPIAVRSKLIQVQTNLFRVSTLVRVVFYGSFPVCFLQLIRCRILGHTKYLVVLGVVALLWHPSKHG
jgi:hypothetical protein